MTQDPGLNEITNFDWVRGEARVAFYSARNWITGGRPALVMIHGAHRSAANLFGWLGRMKDWADVYLLELPAHGRSTAIETPSVQNMARLLGEAIAEHLTGRDIVLAGESIGGLIALTLGGRPQHSLVRSVLALDPPLTTRKLWAWRANQLPQRRLSLRERPALAAFDKEAIGIVDNGFEERIYYELIEALNVPALIAAGDRSIFDPSISHPPAVFDDVDRFVLDHLYPGKVDIRIVPQAGHVLLEQAPDACVDLLREALARVT